MLSKEGKDRLQANWENVDALACMAEFRLYDPSSDWECYILGMNPFDQDQVYVIVADKCLFIGNAILSDLIYRYNQDGEFMEIDNSFVPRKADKLLETLKKRHPWTDTR